MSAPVGVLAVLDRAAADMATIGLPGAPEAIRDARATVERLAKALDAAVTRLDSIGCLASCAPHDDKRKASEAFSTIMRAAYGMRDDLREQLAAFRGEQP